MKSELEGKLDRYHDETDNLLIMHGVIQRVGSEPCAPIKFTEAFDRCLVESHETNEGFKMYEWHELESDMRKSVALFSLVSFLGERGLPLLLSGHLEFLAKYVQFIKDELEARK